MTVFCGTKSLPGEAVTKHKNVVQSIFLPRVNEGNRRIRRYVEPEGATPPGRFVPAGLPREPWQFLGRGGGPRICRISREISRRRDSQDTHITREADDYVDIVTSRVTSYSRARVTIRLNYTPNSRHMDNSTTLKGVEFSGAGDMLLTTLNYFADVSTSPTKLLADWNCRLFH